MRITIGKPARGPKYYPRTEVRNRLIEIIEDEANILISAPRRVGKTSILMDLYDNPPPNCIIVYVDTEAISSSENFFKKLLDELFDLELLEKYNYLGKSIIDKITTVANRIKSIKVAGAGIEVGDKEKTTYFDEFQNFLLETDFEGNKIILMIDEFPVTVENITKEKGQEKAKEFLQLNRSLRLHPKLSDKIQFIYTGSIGLVNVLSKMNTTEDINDLTEETIPPLNVDKSKDLLKRILGEYDIEIEDDIAEYVVNIIEWQIPFYIQSFAREIRNLIREEATKTVSKELVDQSFQNVIDHVNLYLDHYRSRLYKTFNSKELEFIFELLNRIANDNSIKQEELPEIADKHQVLREMKYIISTLEYDGYINNQNSDKVYRFNSPIMKMWWKKYGTK